MNLQCTIRGDILHVAAVGRFIIVAGGWQRASAEVNDEMLCQCSYGFRVIYSITLFWGGIDLRLLYLSNTMWTTQKASPCPHSLTGAYSQLHQEALQTRVRS